MCDLTPFTPSPKLAPPGCCAYPRCWGRKSVDDRFPFPILQSAHSVCRLPSTVGPPKEKGIRWSTCSLAPASGVAPHNRHRLIAFQHTKPQGSRYLPAPTFVSPHRRAASCSIFTQARQFVALVRHEVALHHCQHHEVAHETHGGRIEERGRLSMVFFMFYSESPTVPNTVGAVANPAGASQTEVYRRPPAHCNAVHSTMRGVSSLNSSLIDIPGSIFQYWNEPVEREILPRSQARLYSCSWMVVKRSRRACCSASAAALSLIR